MDFDLPHDARYKFIDLHRTFHELETSEKSISDDVEIDWLYTQGNTLNWDDIASQYRTVILSEAGSGKTTEIRNTTRKLINGGKAAFFLRLEHIPRDFEDAFEEGSIESFLEWLESTEEGWFLLDSVDEARLYHPGDFELAIRKLSRKLRFALDRAHIIITSRTSAWRPKSDLLYCSKLLPYESTEKTKFPFKIVALDNLASEKIEAFVEARGISDSQSFLDAVERADAWSFTTRPLDLEELVEFWLDNDRIGSRLEIMQNSITRRLTESKQSYSEARPLALNIAKEGIRRLAANATLTGNPAIRIPDGTENSKGTPVDSVLPDWDAQDQQTLLSRPIFDDAIYGTVRFHHRSVREYLTAEWFSKLLSRESSRDKIQRLFFRKQYGIEIVVPMVRSILPWLCILDTQICEMVCKKAPEILFEGGDPSQLPLHTRQKILRDVCEKVANATVGQTVHNYSAAQRFANVDLTADICLLIDKYRDNEELSSLLLRMVWLGQLEGALPAVMKVAASSSSGVYVRVSAFRAMYAIGSENDFEVIRQSFLEESDHLNRELLTELVKEAFPSKKTIAWLVSCVNKVDPPEPHSVDNLTHSVLDFVKKCDIEVLPFILKNFHSLLNQPPVIERRYCKVSELFKWLIKPSCKAIERLIVERHPSSLAPSSLAILQKFRALSDYGNYYLSDIKADFYKLVPSWDELNYALFWLDVETARATIDKKSGERLTHFSRAGYFRIFWSFSTKDIDYVLEEISRQRDLDNKLVALSLAFAIYKEAGRPPKLRHRLKKVVKHNTELSSKLNSYLNPPPLSEQERKWRRQDAKWKARDAREMVKRQKYHQNWKDYLAKSMDEDLRYQVQNPGSLTNAVLYLYDKCRDDKRTADINYEHEWELLIPEFGEDIAKFYRDSTIRLWRTYKLKLRSEGFPLNSSPYEAVIGLVGLEAESKEAPNWAHSLDIEEARRACGFATYELNSFPEWFPKLYEAHPIVVTEFLLQELKFELSIQSSGGDTHYIISKIRGSAQWAWDRLAFPILDLLRKEPKNLRNLYNLLIILQGSSLIENEDLRKISSRKCKTLNNLDHLACWYAVWSGVAPKEAIDHFKTKTNELPNIEEQTTFSMKYLTRLMGSRYEDGLDVRGALKTPEHLKSLYLLMHKYIRVEEDIDRTKGGVFSPGLRDHAQEARSNILKAIDEIPGKDAFLALKTIAKNHPNKAERPWLHLKANARAEQDGNSQPWSPNQVIDFYRKLDRTPNTHRELADLAEERLLDFKNDLENGDSSIASILRRVTQETEMRNFIGRELREKSYGRYTVPQEEELADAKRPDIRFHGRGFDAPVPIELKLADNWSAPKLFERLNNQLCGDYLRDRRSSRGIFMLVYRGEKQSWDLPKEAGRVGFSGLVQALQNHWNQISPCYSNIEDITVIGVDLTKRTSE